MTPDQRGLGIVVAVTSNTSRANTSRFIRRASANTTSAIAQASCTRSTRRLPQVVAVVLPERIPEPVAVTEDVVLPQPHASAGTGRTSASPGRARYVGSGPTNSIPYSLQACSIVEALIVVSGDGAVIAR